MTDALDLTSFILSSSWFYWDKLSFNFQVEENCNRESMASTTESQKSEVDALSAKYGKDCRVIADVGDFTFIVAIKMPQVTLKFQLDGK
jgi:hypothetical protein